jgi:hypothetical protein
VGSAGSDQDDGAFIPASTAASIGFGANFILAANAQEKEPMDTSTPSFWPDKARLVISISMQFEAGAQPDRGAGSPFPPIDPKYPDLHVHSRTLIEEFIKYAQKQGPANILLLDSWVFG